MDAPSPGVLVAVGDAASVLQRPGKGPGPGSSPVGGGGGAPSTLGPAAPHAHDAAAIAGLAAPAPEAVLTTPPGSDIAVAAPPPAASGARVQPQPATTPSSQVAGAAAKQNTSARPGPRGPAAETPTPALRTQPAQAQAAGALAAQPPPMAKGATNIPRVPGNTASASSAPVATASNAPGALEAPGRAHTLGVLAAVHPLVRPAASSSPGAGADAPRAATKPSHVRAGGADEARKGRTPAAKPGTAWTKILPTGKPAKIARGAPEAAAKKMPTLFTSAAPQALGAASGRSSTSTAAPLTPGASAGAGTPPARITGGAVDGRVAKDSPTRPRAKHSSAPATSESRSLPSGGRQVDHPVASNPTVNVAHPRAAAAPSTVASGVTATSMPAPATSRAMPPASTQERAAAVATARAGTTTSATTAARGGSSAAATAGSAVVSSPANTLVPARAEQPAAPAASLASTPPDPSPTRTGATTTPTPTPTPGSYWRPPEISLGVLVPGVPGIPEHTGMSKGKATAAQARAAVSIPPTKVVVGQPRGKSASTLGTGLHRSPHQPPASTILPTGVKASPANGVGAGTARKPTGTVWLKAAPEKKRLPVQKTVAAQGGVASKVLVQPTQQLSTVGSAKPSKAARPGMPPAGDKTVTPHPGQPLLFCFCFRAGARFYANLARAHAQVAGCCLLRAMLLVDRRWRLNFTQSSAADGLLSANPCAAYGST